MFNRFIKRCILDSLFNVGKNREISIMKFRSKSVVFLAALSMATTGVLATNQTKASAASVATVNSGVIARLYNSDGVLITNRALSANTPWIAGSIVTINGETMYQVSTDEYLRAADSSLSGQDTSNQTTPTQTTDSNRVATANFPIRLYRDDTNSLSDRSLAKGSSWQIGKFIRNKNNQEFIQVSTHEYADASKFSYKEVIRNPTYIPDFGTNSNFMIIKKGNGDIG